MILLGTTAGYLQGTIQNYRYVVQCKCLTLEFLEFLCVCENWTAPSNPNKDK